MTSPVSLARVLLCPSRVVAGFNKSRYPRQAKKCLDEITASKQNACIFSPLVAGLCAIAPFAVKGPSGALIPAAIYTVPIVISIINIIKKTRFLGRLISKTPKSAANLGTLA
jgi:hypothetical protein